MKNKLFIFSDYELLGETEAFFNGNECITVIHGNDGCYRDEYMNCLFESFDIKPKRINKLNKKQLTSLKEDFGDWLGLE